jgi:hypothetical protein
LGGRESAIADVGVELIDEGAELAAGRGGLPRIQLGDDLIELCDQRVGLVLRQRTPRDQGVDLSDERRDLVLGRGRGLESADVARRSLRPGDAALVGRQAGGVVAGVDRRAAGE